MNQYLLEILKEVSTIIIPGLGALTITNPKTGEILFMPYLKFDDGKLAKHIAEKEGMSENDAKNLIAKYVREVEAKLNVGESYDMYEFGSFSKKPDGEIEFTAWNSSDQKETTSVEPKKKEVKEKPLKETKAAKKETEEKPVKEKKTKKVAEKSNDIVEIKEESTVKSDEPTIVEADKPEIVADAGINDAKDNEFIIIEETAVDEYVPEEPIANEPVEIQKTEDIKQVKEVVSEENNANKIQEIPIVAELKPEEAYTEEKQWEDDLDVPPINAKIERPKKPILEKTTKDKKPKRRPAFFVLLTLGILLIGGAVSVFVFYDKLGNVFPFMAKDTPKEIKKPNEKTEVEEETQASENSEVDTTGTVENIPEEIPTQEESTSAPETQNNSGMIQTSTGLVDPNKPYHIIGGAFTERSNADRYQSKLISSGNSSVIIGQFDKLYIVSISSFSTMEEAQNAMSASKSISSNAWIFKWP